jgi:hypothetical protein
MKVTFDKNIPVPVLKSVTITMTPEQAVQLMLFVGGTNNHQKEAVIFSGGQNEDDTAALKYLNLTPIRGATNISDVYHDLSKMFSVLAKNNK